MPSFKSKDLCTSLENEVRCLINNTLDLSKLSDELLNQQPEPGSWSIAQVLEHLNSYNRYYLPQIETELHKGRVGKVSANEYFKPGFWGDYFTKMMMPAKEGKKVKKYKAPKDHTPSRNIDSEKTLKEFIEGQERLIDFLQQAAYSDMAKLKVPISISQFIKLRLGDTFRFLIAHQQRHFVQIEKVKQHIKV